MKQFVFVLAVALMTACSSKKEGNLVVQGQIKGVKKGTLYLQKMQDTMIVSVDSVFLLNKDTYRLTDQITSPEVYYLTLSDNNTQKSLLFFAEEGIITVNDYLDTYGLNPTIEGSENQKILNQHNLMKANFTNKRLDLIKMSFEAQKEENQLRLDSINKASERLLRRQYLYTTNFAMSNGTHEVAPYIALTELVDANVRLLDTVHASLDSKVKSSLYGKKLQKFIDEIRQSEK